MYWRPGVPGGAVHRDRGGLSCGWSPVATAARRSDCCASIPAAAITPHNASVGAAAWALWKRFIGCLPNLEAVILARQKVFFFFFFKKKKRGEGGKEKVLLKIFVDEFARSGPAALRLKSRKPTPKPMAVIAFSNAGFKKGLFTEGNIDDCLPWRATGASADCVGRDWVGQLGWAPASRSRRRRHRFHLPSSFSATGWAPIASSPTGTSCWRYYQTLARSAANLKLVELGKSSENRPYIALFISSPANLAVLDRLKQLNARLADPRGGSPRPRHGRSSPRRAPS